MKKIIMALLFIFCIASTANAANFVEIHRDDNFIIYLELDSFQNKGDYATCWTKLIPRGKFLERQNKLNKKNVSHFMRFDAYKLNEFQIQLLQAIVYFKDGGNNTLYSSNLLANKWEEVVPGSIAEAVWKSVRNIAKYK